MSYKLKVSETNDLTFEVKEFKDQLRLNIYKSVFSERYTGVAKGSALLFSLDEGKNLLDLVQLVEPDKIKEYGQLQKGAKQFKIYVSTYKGNTSFQIRERVESEKYTGYGKQGLSFSIKLLAEFEICLASSLEEYESVLQGGGINTKNEESKPASNNPEIDTYF